ncbi:branched chain amino acid ABC transporter substrate-binding protein [Sphaerisporangium siamense]|uniref:ABC-type branched-subunit amino acid transport system substrate-binding protein n=1 Tax=Sphaerisporangium siamense TaxID=795645 RepID=A0A7W7GDG6_9ACTN|nr:ABC transporter substrate-binding protein [Sphaerisporangium siamense]MBB4704529.1 ABC-type branched-subunit amino acid transport system substrate-binding protein [Sphaerisporangium siamense]GII86141.1 branched chain amino acid ABC transporter substrate-binding protein [Sphaerisporangium siamense]
MAFTTGRKLTALLGAALSLTACAGKEERAGVAQNTSGGGWSAGRPVVKVGLIGPMTGPFAVAGVSLENSLKVEVDRINAKGGLGGAKLELVVRDSGLDPAKAVQAANEFTGDDSMGLVVGPALSAFYNAAKGTFESGRKVNCQPMVATGDFGALKYGFRAQDPVSLDVAKMIAHVKAEGVNSIGVVYEGDDAGKGTADEVKAQAEAAGLAWKGFEATRPDDQSHRAYIDKLKDAGAIWISNSSSGAKTMAAASEAGYKGLIVGGSGARNISFVEAAGDAADGALFSATYYPYPSRDARDTWKPGYRRHIEETEKRFGKNAGPKTGAESPKAAEIAADCVLAYTKAAEQARSLDPDAVAAALDKLEISDQETPSGNSISPEKHEFFGMDDIHVYEWKKDDKGWTTVEAGK